MKMFYAICLLLCFAGSVHMQAVKASCGANDKCDENLICEDKICRAKINGTCKAASTDECVKTAAACTAEGKCMCPTGSSADDNKTMCACTDATKVISMDKAKCVGKVEGSCNANEDCVMNAMCSDKKCACKANYTASYDMTMCKVSVGQTCTDSANCGENAECNSSKKCACKANYASRNGERCGMKAGETCQMDSQCVTNAMCKTQKCECQSPFTADSDKFCSGASAGMVSLLLLLAALVTSRWI